MTSLRAQFLLDPEIHFLNHGSFGALPRPVLAEQRRWQDRLERQPVAFLGRELSGHLVAARAPLARELHARDDDLLFVPNATYAVNMVARSLGLGPGDEVLMSDQEYGACERVWEFLRESAGFTIRRLRLPSPLPDDDAFAELVWRSVSERTRVLFLSHLTSPTALTLPLSAVCRRARAGNIFTLIDGAHAPGQLALDLGELGADAYTGNHHKWLLAPKGSGFLHVRSEHHDLLQPLVVSWGWRAEPGFGIGSPLLDRFGWAGTTDPTPHLAVPAALSFRREHDWPGVQERCHALLAAALPRLEALTGMPSLYRSDADFVQMAAFELPAGVDGPALQRRLHQEHRIEVPATRAGDRTFLRISVQAYNDESDLEALIDALERSL